MSGKVILYSKYGDIEPERSRYNYGLPTEQQIRGRIIILQVHVAPGMLCPMGARFGRHTYVRVKQMPHLVPGNYGMQRRPKTAT